MDDNDLALFAVFNEIGIINQLSSTVFQSRLPDGLLVSHFSVLNHLARLGDGRTPLSIANAFQVPKTTMTHTLGALEKRRLIKMAPNPADGRSKVVVLTEAGQKAREDAIAAMTGPLHRLAEGVGRDALMDLLPRLAALREFLDDNRNI
ncbi:MarR family winged helix-turn-helix transcriptional regulator [Yoonia litorea]|uniref:Transcriptional regulator, MarR family n=1 Tax=Yoonia litorea TaxID=1123755 RepID=A0A1I6MKV5_9RHOB|nr:MarR family winged helix-turn-helix transcriptional regulator [Yoonia litorea]SFS16238.1 transcriptional regulator, MarR family [Yoonia litorea]